MGKKSAPTIGYWYKLAIQFLLGKAIDVLLEIRGGDKTAWTGFQDESGTFTINALNLWGGEKAEGGIQGDFELMMGLPDQMPNAYLGEVFGAKNPGYRGKATGVFKGGLYGAFNPYPKPMSFKARRIVTDWPEDICWYEEKAPVPYGAENAVYFWSNESPYFNSASHYSFAGGGLSGSYDSEAEWLDALEVSTGHAYELIGRQTDASGNALDDLADFISLSYTPLAAQASATLIYSWQPLDVPIYVSKPVQYPGGATQDHTVCQALITAHGLGYYQRFFLQGYVNTGVVVLQPAADPAPAGYDYILDTPVGGVMSLSIGSTKGYMYFCKSAVATRHGGDGYGMNPAHMLYESIIAPWGMGEPASLIDEASFTAAADKLYAEGFALCTKFNPRHETVEQFQRRIEQIIDGRLTPSRVDGKYYLNLIRADYVLDDLPILTDDDILEFREEDSDPLESVNQVMVEWFDPEAKEKRITQPVNALAAIRASGGIKSETGTYPEFPYEALALRVGGRDLGYKSKPAKRFSLTTTRVPYNWLGGQLFRLQAPRRGIADMVCLLGELGAGVPRSGSMRLKAAQFVSALRSAVYVNAETGVDHTPSPTPVATSAQQVIEAPYVEVAQKLSTADLAVLPSDAGYMMAMAKRPSGGLNYALYTGAGSEDLIDRGYADFCPTALVVEAADREDTTFTLSDPSDLADVQVGTLVLWGNELARVDAIDAEALTLELGRGCGDTVAQVHAAGARIWFIDDGCGSDSREYSAAEVVHAKLLTRTSSAELALADATDQTVTMDSRAARPYPPARPRINGLAPGAAVSETFTLSWFNRDRLMQADQLVDQDAASVGPEANVSYTVQVRNDATDALIMELTGLGGSSVDILLAADYAGGIRIEMWSVREGLESWQSQVTDGFAYTRGAAGAAYAGANPGSPGTSSGTTATPEPVGLWAAAGGTSDAITASFADDYVLADGLEFRVRAQYANGTTTPTFNPDGHGGLTMYREGGNALEIGDIRGSGHELTIRHRTSPARYELLNPATFPRYATQTYVDAKVAGLSWKQQVRAKTTGALAANTYSNGSSGVGATLTGNSNGALAAQDGVTLVVGDRLLVDAEVAAANRGIYVLSQVGDASHPYILTRATDADAGAELVNASVYVSEGTSYADTQWTCTTNATITVGTTSLTFAQVMAGTADIAALIHAATGKTTPVDADEFGIVDSAASNVLKKLTWANLKAAMWAAWGALINSGTGKTTPVDADAFALMDSAASNATKKLTFSDLKTAIKSALGLTAGSTSTGYLAYNGTTQAAGQLDGGTTAPSHATRTNYDGYFYATRFYGDGSQLTGITATGLPVGSQVNWAYASTSTPVSTSDTSIPRDNTKPQNTEGVAWSALDCTITPTSAGNKLRVTLSIPMISASGSAAIVIAVFRDSGADAVWSTLVSEPTNGQNFPNTFTFVVDAGSTSATTFKVRWCTSASTGYFLRTNATAAFFDGTMIATLEVAEIKQ